MKRWGGAIAYTEWFPNKLPRFFSREICEGGKTGLSPIVTAVRSHLGFYLLKGMGAVKKAIAILENEKVGRCDRP
ncbi:hypothetical protein [Cylindrospermopsis raciborskii]|uniref:hypothetical protein n=1 Tax=Cylindrospermopsis raciborskii TaxID=77022 RepID=UPI0008DDB325|nr:hypothetical protein [Cylindrospermopsis raciborskii]NLQ05511.1 hypothetical protein [Cylindrospermopsis raciborskii MVCC19]OHY35919.1 hypothetical protein BCV64_02750 [Cylindrospermopsis raciborskii MVCC14]